MTEITNRIREEERRAAHERLRDLLVVGALLCLVGGVLIAVNWPGTQATSDLVPTGNQGWVNFGFAVGGVGNMLLLVSLIGFGVKLGNRAA